MERWSDGSRDGCPTQSERKCTEPRDGRLVPKHEYDSHATGEFSEGGRGSNERRGGRIVDMIHEAEKGVASVRVVPEGVGGCRDDRRASRGSGWRVFPVECARLAVDVVGSTPAVGKSLG